MHEARDRNAGLWIEHNDRLYVAVYSSVASLSVMFSGYFRKMNGEIIEYASIVNPTSDRAVTAITQHFGAGFLLSCVASLTSGNANRGQCYVRAQIQRSSGVPTIKLHNVLGGYLTDEYSPSFPHGKIEGPLEGPGILRSITGTDPAAGVEITETVPTGARWRFYSLRVTFVSAVAVANRQPTLTLDDGTSVFFRSAPTANQVAADTQVFNWAHGVEEDTSSGTALTLPFMSVVQLLAGWRIRSLTGGLQAADDYGAPQFLVEEWIEA